MHDKVRGQTPTGVTLALVLIVTLTFDLATFFLVMTHSFVMMLICAKLFSNSIMHNKGMCWTQPGVTEAYAQSLSATCGFDF